MVSNYTKYLTELKLTKFLDVDKTPLDDAITYAVDNLSNLYDIIPKFDNNYRILQQEVKYGTYRRSQMPVIRSHDNEWFQEWLLSEGVKHRIIKKSVDTLKPSQRQIYLSKIITNIKKNGFSKTVKWVTDSSLFMVSKDGYIIDGHHRFGTAILIDPKTRVRCLVIDLSQAELLKKALYFSDKVAKNSRNESVESSG